LLVVDSIIDKPTFDVENFWIDSIIVFHVSRDSRRKHRIMEQQKTEYAKNKIVA